MYFVYRDGVYKDVSGQSFRDFLDGRLPGLPGEQPNLDDWEAHLTTLFPEVRLKRYIEMRGADSGPWDSIWGLPAFWVGLMYSADSLDGAYGMIAGWTPEDHEYLRKEAPKTALATEFHGRTVGDLARKALVLSRASLAGRAILDSKGKDETHYLDPLDVIVESGRTPAEGLLEAYHGYWAGDIDALFKDCMYSAALQPRWHGKPGAPNAFEEMIRIFFPQIGARLDQPADIFRRIGFRIASQALTTISDEIIHMRPGGFLMT